MLVQETVLELGLHGSIIIQRQRQRLRKMRLRLTDRTLREQHYNYMRQGDVIYNGEKDD